ncbi:MAG: hypothetical protein OJF51_000577 [Nitrospira sp.]|nr:MAG: hypothetical protein OJF51_000577 [Nitrospira sp.]
MKKKQGRIFPGPMPLTAEVRYSGREGPAEGQKPTVNTR